MCSIGYSKGSRTLPISVSSTGPLKLIPQQLYQAAHDQVDQPQLQAIVCMCKSRHDGGKWMQIANLRTMLFYFFTSHTALSSPMPRAVYTASCPKPNSTRLPTE